MDLGEEGQTRVRALQTTLEGPLRTWERPAPEHLAFFSRLEGRSQMHADGWKGC